MTFDPYVPLIFSGDQWAGPRNGSQDDKAHPPIHPVKMANRGSLGSEEWSVYELVVRHFLGSIAKDAVGSETVVKVEIAGEIFSA
jgi:DNA topoisomerase-3